MQPISYSLYLDSSGDAGWPTPYGASHNNHFVLAGLALTPQMDYQAQSKVKEISEKYLGRCLSGYYELNYSSLIYGKKPYDQLSHPNRKAMADEVFDLIIGLEPVLFATVVDKVKMKIRYGSKAINPKEYAFRGLSARFSMFLKKKKTIGYMVMDTEEYRKDKALQSLVHKARKFGINICGWSYHPTIDHLELCLNTVTFVPSEMSPGIQLTDFCAHSIFKYSERGKGNRYNQLSPLFNRNGSKVYEPSFVPK